MPVMNLRNMFIELNVNGNLKLALSRQLKSQKVTAMLGEILYSGFGKASTHDLHLTSAGIKAYAIRE